MTTVDRRLPSTPAAVPFAIEGPLAPAHLDKSEAPFAESEAACDDYLTRRSPAAQTSAHTYQLVSGNGDIAGYISFRVRREGGSDLRHVFIDVEAIYLAPAFRMRRLSRLLLGPVLGEVRASVHAREGAGRPRQVLLHFNSQFESPAGKRFLRALEEELLLLAKRHAGVSLLGWRPAYQRAKKHLWARHMRGAASP